MNTAGGKRPMRNLSVQEKLNAVYRVRNGSSKASVARDIGVPESTLRGWCKNENKLLNALNKSILAENGYNAPMYSELPQQKQAKLDISFPFNFTNDAKMNYVANKSRTSLSAKDFSSSEKGITLHNTSSNFEAIYSRIKYENNVRDYGADPKQSDKSTEAVSTGTNQSTHETGFSNSRSNGLSTVRPKQIPNRLKAKDLTESHHKSLNVDNFGMGVDMIDKPKESLVNSLSRHSPMKKVLKRHRQEFNSALPHHSYEFQHQKKPSMQTALGISEDLQNSAMFRHVYSQLVSSMMTETLRYNNNSGSGSKQMCDNILLSCVPKKDMTESSLENNIFNSHNQNYVNEPEDLSIQRRVLSSTSFHVPEKKSRVGGNDIGQSNVEVKIELNYSDRNGISEAVEHGQKFLNWLETYSGPTVTSMQVKQCRSLLQCVRNIAERVNN